MGGKAKIAAGVLSLAAVTAGIVFAQTGSKYRTQEQVNLLLSNVTSNSAKEAGKRFKELAEEYSGGTVTVDLFPDNQLGDDKTVVEGVQNGDIDIAVASTSSLSTLFKDYYLYDTPYLFLSADEVYDVGFNGETAREMLEGVSEIGLRHMAMWENGFRNYTNNDHPIEVPEDCRGQKIRTMENPIHMKAWKAVGANPTPMAFSELFTAMQQGTVDGEENPLGIIYSNRFYEVQKYITMTQHVYTPYVVLMNPDKYEALTDEQREAVDRAMREATEFQLETSAQEEKTAVRQMEEYGCQVNELTPEAKEQFQEIILGAGVYDTARQSMEHPEYLEQMQQELLRYREEGRQ